MLATAIALLNHEKMKKQEVKKIYGKEKAELEQTVIPFKTPYNADNFPKDAEENYDPSLTIPDETMSVRELMDRQAKGLPLNGQKVPMYDSDMDDLQLPDLTGKDLAEIQEIRESVQSEIDRIKNDQQEQSRKRQLAAYEKRIEDEVKKRTPKPPSEEPK